MLEFNGRFGDPECQVLCVRLMSDFLPALIAASEGVLASFAPALVRQGRAHGGDGGQGLSGRLSEGHGNPRTGKGRSAARRDGVHAGTKGEDGRILANGGRVLNVTATGKTIAEAQRRAYEAVDLIDWPEGFCRRDIGWRAARP